jgi:hypothetical protein
MINEIQIDTYNVLFYLIVFIGSVYILKNYYLLIFCGFLLIFNKLNMIYYGCLKRVIRND